MKDKTTQNPLSKETRKQNKAELKALRTQIIRIKKQSLGISFTPILKWLGKILTGLLVTYLIHKFGWT